VITGPVITALEAQKLMNGGNRNRIPGAYPKLPSARRAVRGIPDVRATRPHGSRSGDFTIVNESRKIEVALLEGSSDFPHVRTDSGYTCSIRRIPRKRDAPAIRQRLELVPGGVLVHAHCCVTARLHQGEGAVGGVAAG
jgi:hypothetical protein